MNVTKAFVLISTLALVVGCASEPTIDQFRQVKRGMPKYDVLELVGEPIRVRRARGQDRWTYQFRRDDGVVAEREVVFDEGKVVYAGLVRDYSTEETTPTPATNTSTPKAQDAVNKSSSAIGSPGRQPETTGNDTGLSGQSKSSDGSVQTSGEPSPTTADMNANSTSQTKPTRKSQKRRNLYEELERDVKGTPENRKAPEYEGL